MMLRAASLGTAINPLNISSGVRSCTSVLGSASSHPCRPLLRSATCPEIPRLRASACILVRMLSMLSSTFRVTILALGSPPFPVTRISASGMSTSTRLLNSVMPLELNVW